MGIMEEQSRTAPWRKSVVVVLGSALLVAAMVVFKVSSRGLVGITNNDLVNFEEKTCSQSHENCMESRCCADDGAKCFMKNQYWASCKETCDKDYQDEYDKSMNITAGWECKELNTEQVLHCAKDTEDCSANTNCCDGGSGEKMVSGRLLDGQIAIPRAPEPVKIPTTKVGEHGHVNTMSWYVNQHWRKTRQVPSNWNAARISFAMVKNAQKMSALSMQNSQKMKAV